MIFSFDKLQSVGKALMLPVAVLPVAAILLRFGANDVLNIDIFEQTGRAIFDNLPIIFAIGIAFGLTRDKHDNGAAGLAGFVCYSVLTTALKSVDNEIDMGVFAGIFSGLVAGLMYNRFYNIKLPNFLGFFGGRRFVPIVTSFAAIFLAMIFSFVWPPIQDVINSVGKLIIGAGGVGTFIYGVLNRLLIPLGLHHILNNLVWFAFGEYTNPLTGEVFTGDLNRFFAGDPTAGTFMAGGFPVMMSGLPAVALAMYRTARPENRPKIAGALASMAFTSFLTGITEPIEFSFMFLAPALYVVHAIFMGMSMAFCSAAGILIGCSFSMGFIDYVLNFGIATKPLLIIPVGIVFGLLYYVVFSQIITGFDLPTIGRFDEPDVGNELSDDELSMAIVKGLGGMKNIDTMESCVTRLRLTIKDTTLLDEKFLKTLSDVNGLITKDNAVQIILGFRAEAIADAISRFGKR